ncbi:hypothetical protein XSR1_30067 [Xenorhabdus szentirmaii DSM 16338]|uniref:Uncharacterized protein n=1 Tax=Xenorhabdus szentirmaii DSM 16338 TaxID=1427518 RepID=W1IZE9_9GAMM|nr:hypothetical protein XSR1_30067 [Xenorhabdus szentirmaii DSM 16338]
MVLIYFLIFISDVLYFGCYYNIVNFFIYLRGFSRNLFC